jgi:competence protein ComEC
MILLLFLAFSTLLDPAPIDINSAFEEELCRLNGIGPVTASAIVEYRENISPFFSVEELLYVPGIGQATLEAILPYVVAEGFSVPPDTGHFLQVAAPPDTLLTVIFLDIGNGDAIVLQSGSSTWLIDAGPPGNGALRAPVVQRLIECGIDTLTAVAFTHPHADHIGGCVDALEIFNCGQLIDPGIDLPSPVYEGILQYVLESGCEYSVLSGNDRWELSDDAVLEVVWLERGAGSANEASAVFKVSCGDFSLLITGDIEIESIMNMTSSQSPVTVMKIPHHASRSSLFFPWYRKAAPQFAVVCCGRSNPFGHPHRDVLAALESIGTEILRTDTQSNIFLFTDGESISFNSSFFH